MYYVIIIYYYYYALAMRLKDYKSLAALLTQRALCQETKRCRLTGTTKPWCCLECETPSVYDVTYLIIRPVVLEGHDTTNQLQSHHFFTNQIETCIFLFSISSHFQKTWRQTLCLIPAGDSKHSFPFLDAKTGNHDGKSKQRKLLMCLM